ncbi:FAD-dependent oxidoreductase [Mesorhizobium sp. M0184]|uniref:NAD(P)/FAD-dependent oxidoreductase n=1 Tax=Mesorhizobium sp. M0184 TaxID=2956906 RepID=UPI00333BFF94
MMRRLVIVGGGQAGGRVAQIVSNAGRDFEITLISSEAHPPYNRPPLSKGVLLGTSELADCLIWREHDLAWQGVDLVANVSAAVLEIGNKAVQTSTGQAISYDKLVIATGSYVREFSVPGSHNHGVHSLRTFDDAKKIGKHFSKGKRLIVVGGGFIGLEVAAAARLRGMSVLVVEASDRLLARIAPRRLSEAVALHHHAAGVNFRFGSMIERFAADASGALKSAHLSTGETIPCDVAVVGTGVSANTSLAKSAGLTVEGGIITDSGLRTSHSDIYACGDCASFWHPLFERHIRVEAWRNAEDHARIVSASLLGQEVGGNSVPFFWSDQYDWSIQIVGLPHLGSSAVTRHIGDAFILYHLDVAGRLIGATGFGKAEIIGREIRRANHWISERLNPDLKALENGMLD